MRNRTRGLLRSTGASSDELDCEPASICVETPASPCGALNRLDDKYPTERTTGRHNYGLLSILALLVKTLKTFGDGRTHTLEDESLSARAFYPFLELFFCF